MRKIRVGESAGRDGDAIGHPLRLPKDIRPAANAEVKLYPRAAGGIALESVRRAFFDANGVASVKHGNAECAPCSALAVKAVAHRNPNWITVAPEFNLTTMAMCPARSHGCPTAVDNRDRREPTRRAFGVLASEPLKLRGGFLREKNAQPPISCVWCENLEIRTGGGLPGNLLRPSQGHMAQYGLP